jgi:Protein of unknown function (DUF3168)
MNLFGAIYGVLYANSAVNAIVGNKIFDLVVSQTATAPFLAISQVTVTANGTKSGASITDEYRMQVAIVAETQTVAKDLAEKVRTALDYYSGTSNGVNIQQAWFENEAALWDDTSHLRGSEALTQDYIFRVNR